MKITQTTQCPFCQTALIKRKSSFSYILDCPKQQDHAANTLWYWFDDASNKNKITAINVCNCLVFISYQFSCELIFTQQRCFNQSPEVLHMQREELHKSQTQDRKER